MKTKLLVLLTLFATAFTLNIFANQTPFILKHDGLIDLRAQEKIFEIGTESKSKLNVNIYAFIIENNGIDKNLPILQRKTLMKSFEQSITKNLQKPYSLLLITIDQKHANILTSQTIADKIDKDDILDNYVIPLLASKDKNTLFAKTSAAMLNGYAQIADSLAKAQGIKLESSIGSEGKTAGTIWRVFMYTLVFVGILLYAIIVMRERKFKKMNKQ